MKKKLILTLINCFIFFSFINAQGNWKVYTNELNAGSLRTGNYTKHFCEDQSGNLWVSASNGCILKFNNNKWTVYDVEKINFLFGQSNAAVIAHAKTGVVNDWEIAPDNNGKWVWFGSSRGVVLWDGIQMLEMTGTLDEDNKMIFYSDENKENYIINDNEIVKYYNPKTIKTKNPVIQIKNLFVDSKNRLWIGNWKGDIFSVNKGIWTEYDYMRETEIKKEVKRGARVIRKIFEDKDGLIWILCNSFVATYNGNEMSTLKEVSYPRAIFQDSKNNIWISYSEGIFKYDGTNWKEYEKEEFNAGGESKFIEDKNGILWYSSKVVFATRKGGCLYKFAGNEWEKIKIEKYHTDIFEDSKGNIWGSGMRGLYQLINNKWELKRKAVGFAVFFNEIYEAKNSDIWIGTSTVSGHIERYSPN